MKRPNRERMIKHAARGVPDRVQRVVKSEQEYQKFYAWFEKKMIQKGKQYGTVEVTAAQNYIDTTQIVTLEWKPVTAMSMDEYAMLDVERTLASFGFNPQVPPIYDELP